MGIKQVVCCDKCDKVIEDGVVEPKGFAFVGNVHGVKNNEKDCVGGGFVGNNLWYDEKGGAVVENTSYYCWDCTVKVLFGKEYELRKNDSVLFRQLKDTTSFPNIINSIDLFGEDYDPS